jgi:hypothetical protein
VTPEEAERVALIVAQADGQCVVCASELAEQLQLAFPEHDWAVLVAGDRWTPEAIRSEWR